jgi:ribonuclease J
MNDADRLIYLALGGAGEIGMNMYVYGYGPPDRERLILVDAGVTFPNMDSSPGVELIMADPAWLQARADRLEAVFITHAHEDHVGALGLLYPRLKVPVYARRFTAAIAQNKMERAGQDTTMVRQVDPWPRRVETGPFTVGFVPIAHSIPEASGLAIDTPAGRVFHTADFKVDKTPVVGEPFDAGVLREIGEGGIRALVCDSTNVFNTNPGRSEATLTEPIRALMREAKGMVVATTFASNVARLKTLAEAGQATGRSVLVLGRAMNEMLRTARATEVLHGFPPVIDPPDAEAIPRDRLLVLASGSQGERRAASAQLAAGKYMGIEMQAGDTFLFSSKTIPGNELDVARILNQLSEKGVRAIEDTDGRYHVSGHPNRPDLIEMHLLMRPGVVVPMHGEHRHLVAHADLARELDLPALVAPNGTVLDIGRDPPRAVETVETGRLYLDGTQLIGARDGVVRDRIHMALRGHVLVSIVIDEDGLPLGGAWVEAVGLPEVPRLADGVAGALEAEIDRDLRRAKRKELASDDAVEQLAVRACHRACNLLVGKKPICTVLISRLEA